MGHGAKNIEHLILKIAQICHLPPKNAKPLFAAYSQAPNKNPLPQGVFFPPRQIYQ